MLERSMPNLKVLNECELSISDRLFPEYGGAEIAAAKRIGRPDLEYFVRPSPDPVFFPGMGAEIVLRNISDGDEQTVGVLGVVHPIVLKNYKVDYPTTIVELNVEALE